MPTPAVEPLPALLTDRPAEPGAPREPDRPWHTAPAGADLGRDRRWWSGVWAALLARYSGHDRVWLAGPDGWYEVPVDQDAPVGELIAATAAALDGPAFRPSRPPAAPVAPVAGGPGEHRGVGDLAVELADEAVEVAGAARLWEPSTLHRLAGQLRLLGERAHTAPDTPLTEVDLLTDADRRLLTEEWNRTAAPFPATGYLELIAHQVRTRPDAPAVEQGERVVSFAELDRRGDQIAGELRRAGVVAGDHVGLFCPRGLDYVLAVLGILKAGAAIVPLDPVNPDARIAFMLRDSAATAVLTTEGLPERLPQGVDRGFGGRLAQGADGEPGDRLAQGTDGGLGGRLAQGPGDGKDERAPQGTCEGSGERLSQDAGDAPGEPLGQGTGSGLGERPAQGVGDGAGEPLPRDGGDGTDHQVMGPQGAGGRPGARLQPYLPVIDIAATADAPVRPPGTPVAAEPLSHLIYTSGSTGEPKAVLERLRAIENLVHWTGRAYAVRPGDRASWLSAPGFGVQIMEWMPHLALGATVCVPAARHALSPAQLRDWLVAERITHTMLVAALAEPAWALDWPADAALRVMVTTAERVHSWPPVDTPFRVVMTYGTTESTNALTCLDLGAGIDLTSQATPAHIKAAHPVPAGRPIANVRAYVLDALDRPVPPGLTGRLLIGGAGLSTGYHKRPELTRKLFRPDPVTGEGLVYETGDLARYRADGAIEILGRGDAQVKIRGFRVELGEVETALIDCPEVAEAVVTTVRTGQGGPRLAAYVTACVSADGGTGPDGAALKARLSERLPYYMVPATVTTLDRIPRLPNGKTDLRALPDPDPAVAGGDGFVPARSETEAAMAGLWAEIFDGRTISMTDNFFHLGGHSLLAFRLIDELRGRFGTELSMTELYANPTAGELSAAVEAGRTGSAAYAGLPPVEPDPAARYEPFPLNDGQQAMWIGRGGLVELGNVGCHGYFEWESYDLDLDAFEHAWQLLVERHDALRTVVLADGTQHVLAEVPDFVIRRHDLRAAADPEPELLALRARLSHTILDAATWPLFDLRLTLLPGGRTRIHLVLDFLVADAWSYFQVIVPELSELYAGRGAALEPLRLTFRDYVLGLAANLPDSDVYQRSQWYWLDRLEALPGAPRLPERPAHQPELAARIERHSGVLAAADWAAIGALAAEHDVTGSGVLATAYAEVLRSWSAEPSFCLNFPLFSRLPLHPQIGKVIGHTTTTLLLEATGSGDTFGDRARTLQQRLWADLEHRHFTGMQVLRALTRLRGTLTPAMPVVMTSLVGYPPDQRRTTFGSAVYGISQTPQVSLDFQVFETEDGGLRFNWDYIQAVYPDGLIGEMFTAFLDLLARLTTRAGWSAGDFGYGTARHTAGATDPGAVAGAQRTGAAWERYWSSVDATGRGGDVLWDADDADEMRWLLDTTARHLDPALPVIDLGCGNGRYARALATRFHAVVGVDVSPTAIARARTEGSGSGDLSFEVLDPGDPAAVEALAKRIGPANVFIRAVLHVLGEEERAATAAALAVLTGGRGGVLLIEPDYARDSFGYLGHVGGARGRAAHLVRPLEAAGVRHSTPFGPADLDRYFPADRWRRLSAGAAQMYAVDPESDRGAIRVPGYLAAVRPRTPGS
ncbi:AMP-binding protein [Streptomyces sp. NPDC046976]|uniref:AMP-binding protein n=1 Tax=Streptomyces sp. NPDC046976 TaxID=3155258 RepID=UPI0033C415FE